MCPSCGAKRGRVFKIDEDEHGQPLRLRRCPACGAEYPTIEVVITNPGVTFYSLAARRRDYERYRKRERLRRGPMHISKRGKWLRAKPYLEVSVKVRWAPNKGSGRHHQILDGSTTDEEGSREEGEAQGH